MSLYNDIKKAGTGYLGDMGVDEVKRAFFPLHDITYHRGSYKFNLYTLDFYGMVYYDKPWDYWRKEFIRTSVHERVRLPFYVPNRSRLFDKKYSYKVDK